MPEQKSVLILCTGNSCRSQLAEALWRHEAGTTWKAASAGTDPKGVNPRSIQVLAEMNVPTDALRSKNVEELMDQQFDLVITVCDNAKDSCPAWPGHSEKLHWPFEDPADATGTEEEIVAVFRKVRDQIHQRIRAYLHQEVSDPT